MSEKKIKIPIIIFGNVNENGTIHSGDGFTCTKNATGKYKITFDTPFSTKPSVNVTQVYTDFDNTDNTYTGSLKDNSVIFGLHADYFFCAMGDANGDPSNRDFSFMAVGYV